MVIRGHVSRYSAVVGAQELRGEARRVAAKVVSDAMQGGLLEPSCWIEVKYWDLIARLPIAPVCSPLVRAVPLSNLRTEQVPATS